MSAEVPGSGSAEAAAALRIVGRPRTVQAYRFVQVDGFPTLTVGGEPFGFSRQLSLLDPDRPAETRVDRVAVADLPGGFYAANVQHDVEEPIWHRDQRGELHPSTVVHHEFRLYHAPATNSVLFAGPKRAVSSFIRESRQRGLAEFREWEVNFAQVLANLTGDLHFRGAWLRTDQPNMRTLAMFGDHIETAEQFQQVLAEGGEISSMYVADLRYDRPMMIQITANATIVLMHRILSVATATVDVPAEVTYLLRIVDETLHDALQIRQRRQRATTPEAERVEEPDPTDLSDLPLLERTELDQPT